MTTPTPPLRIGAFELIRPVSKGGLATVWRAKHIRTGRDAAVKVVRPQESGQPQFRRIFVTDAQSIARIAHPNVVQLYDTGDVSTETAQASDGELAAGSPYLVMEYAPNGTIEPGTRLGWREWAHTMTQTLRGLAHVHCRGMLHLDLKPGNLLVWGADPATWHIKLTDFGTARRYQEVERAAVERWDLVQGTPIYMSPEQFGPEWTQLSPQSDLYSMGIVGYELAFGRAPFEHREVVEMYRAHLHQAVSVPAYDGPDGFAGWLWKMLAKEPDARFSSAAAAARALERLHSPLSITLSDIDWREAERPRPTPLVQDEMLRLMALREPPLVGREREQDALWSTLQQVLRTGSPRVVLLSGVAGTGKSRLAGWLGERAGELGLAQAVRARHDRIPANHHGVRGLLDVLLKTQQRDRAQVEREVVERLSSDLRDAADSETLKFRTEVLVDLLRPASDKGAVVAHTSVTDASAVDVEVACRRLIEACARKQPMVLHLDDAHWDVESLSLAASILAASQQPILVVVTVRDTDLHERPIARIALEELAEHGAETIEVQALARRWAEQLAVELTNLDAVSLREVVARTDGNPLFTIELVQKLHESSALELKDGFYGLKDPEGLGQIALDGVWHDRIQHALVEANHKSGSKFGVAALREALEIGCVLGASINIEEWRRATAGLPGGVVEAVSDALAAANLAELQGEPKGALLNLRHPLIRETVAAAADKEGRGQARHARAAEALSAVYPSPQRAPREVAVRIGRHLMASHANMAALDWLSAAAVDDFSRPLKKIREQVYPLMRALVSRVGQDNLSPALLLSYLELKTIAAQNDNTAGLDGIDSVLEWQAEANKQNDPAHICLSAQMLAYEQLFRGNLVEAERVAREALATARAYPEQPWYEVEVLRALSEVLVTGDQYEEARATVQRIFDILPDPQSRAAVVCYYTLGRASSYLGDQETALEQLDTGVKLASARGWESIVAVLLTAVGAAYSRAGRLQESEKALTKSADYFRLTRNSRVAYPLVNLAEVSIVKGEFSRGLGYATEALEQATLRTQHAQCVFAAILQSACFAALKDWDNYDVALDVSEEHLAHTTGAGREMRVVLLLVARHVQQDEQPERWQRLRTIIDNAQK